MKMRSFARVIVLAGRMVGLISSTAFAAKTGPGTSTGTGQVFLPNPVAFLRDQALDRPKRCRLSCPCSLLINRAPLPTWMAAVTCAATGPTSAMKRAHPAFSATNTFLYTRDDDRFEQVMAYYWVTEAQKYIQSLGFGTTYGPDQYGIPGCAHQSDRDR